MFHSGLENAFRAIYGRYDYIWYRYEWRSICFGWKSPLGSSAWTWNGEAVWAMASIPPKTLSNAPGCLGCRDQDPEELMHEEKARCTAVMSFTTASSNLSPYSPNSFLRCSPLSRDRTTPLTAYPFFRRVSTTCTARNPFAPVTRILSPGAIVGMVYDPCGSEDEGSGWDVRTLTCISVPSPLIYPHWGSGRNMTTDVPHPARATSAKGPSA